MSFAIIKSTAEDYLPSYHYNMKTLVKKTAVHQNDPIQLSDSEKDTKKYGFFSFFK